MKPWLMAMGMVFALLALGCDNRGEVLQDFDGDGSLDANDCDPADASIYPGAEDPWNDGIDQDCDGRDGVDSDGDGFPANLPEGDPFLDCDDNNPMVYPGTLDLISDGADRNCDGHPGIDSDEDGHASLASEGLDCDDTDPLRHPGAADPYGDALDQDCSGGDGLDADGDGFPSEDLDYEGAPTVWDCNDSNSQIHPGALEIEGDGIDNDCDGFDAADVDQDGHIGDEAGGDDCDDADVNTYPGATEQADGVDNDCDGTVDEGTTLYDDDGDGFSEVEGDCDDDNSLLAPIDADGDGFTLCDDDCDDSDPLLTPSDFDQDGVSGCLGDCNDFDNLIGPAAAEVCNLVDDNCDGVQIDEQDSDSDGSPSCDDCDDANPLVEGLDADGDSFTTCQGDCDDSLPQRNPYASDAIGDGIDQNCDGTDGIDVDGDGAASALSGGSDCDDTDPALNQDDADGDGASTCGADALVGTSDDDCDDSNDQIFPGATDLCGDGIDQDCVGGLSVETDDDGDGSPECAGDCDDSDATLTPVDTDNDGLSSCDGDCDDTEISLNLTDADTDGYSTCAGDCDDLAPGVNPGASEVCNLIDDNCDGQLLTGEADADGDLDPLCTDCDDTDPVANTLDTDGDGFDTCTGGDCNDLSIAFTPISLDGFGDSYDTNCDGIDGIDGDGDGFASSAGGGPDCDDGDASRFPGAVETTGDGIDQDCDGLDAADVDGDGYVSVLTGGEDCNDGDAAIYPGFFEDPDDGIDSNCDGADGNTFQAFTGAAASSSSYGDGTAHAPQSVATCDINGDGYLDLAVGSPLWDADSSSSSGSDEGQVGIWYGPISGGGVVSGAPARLVIERSSGAVLGYSVACLGDTDGDGQEELAVGGPFVNGGTVFLVQGQISGELVLDPDAPSPSYIRLSKGQQSQYSGYIGTLLDSGDFDGDGIGDLVVGADYVSSYTYWPPNSSSSNVEAFILSGPLTDQTLVSDTAVASVYASFSGSSPPLRRLAVAGDTNGDGMDDLLLALPEADSVVGGGTEGGVYLFLGPLAGTLVPSAAQAEIVGDTTYGPTAGWAADGVGDLNNDGFDDIAVAVPHSSWGSGGDWGVHLFFGPISGTLQLQFADAILTTPLGVTSASLYFSTVAGIGDIDGDGLGDLLIAYDQYNSGQGDEEWGGARVAFGPFGGVIDLFGATTEPLGNEGSGGSNTAHRACAARSADLNGDGWPDPVVLRPQNGSGYQGEASSVRVYINPYAP